MLSAILHKGKTFSVDLLQPIDISIPLSAKNVNAFHLPQIEIEPVRIGDFVGNVNQGGACNVNNIFFSPHGNGTHTECVGHISKKFYSINQCLTQFFFTAKLITITPEEIKGDKVITKRQLEEFLSANLKPQTSNPEPEALIIRTLPNTKSKLTRKYSGTNPAYLQHQAAKYICDLGIEHLLLDVPSVDREEDGGKLLAHHAFWNYPEKPRTQCTITELIYVDNKIPDGNYLLNIQIASFENDASPSKPLLFGL